MIFVIIIVFELRAIIWCAKGGEFFVQALNMGLTSMGKGKRCNVFEEPSETWIKVKHAIGQITNKHME